MDQVITPLAARRYRFPKAQIAIGLWVGDQRPTRVKNVGDYEDLNLAYDVEETEIEANDTVVKETVMTILTKLGGTFTFSARQVASITKAVMYMGKRKEFVQTANKTYTLSGLLDIEVGDIFPSEIFQGLDAEITGSDGVDDVVFLKGTHLKLSSVGTVEVIAIPDGYDPTIEAELVVTGPATEVKSDEYSLLTGSFVTCEIHILQLDDNGDVIVLPKVELRADGDVALGSSGSDPTPVSFTGKLVKDITRPADRRFGYAIRNNAGAAE